MTRRLLGFSLVVVIVASAQVASAQITMTPNPVAVGNVAVGATGQATGNITNSGSERLDLVVGTCTGSGTGTFALTPNSNINPPRDISVSYTPTARGAVTCTVDVRAYNTVTSLGTFSVTGNGIAPVVGVSPATHDFMGVRVLDSAAVSTRTQVFTVSNTGDAGQNLVVSSIAFSGAHPGNFSVTAGPTFPATIAPGATAQWSITFNPSAAGARSATMTIASNDPITPNRTVSLTGTGTTAVIALTDVAFGTVTAGGTAAVTSSTLSNSATSNAGTLTATSAILTNAAPTSWFSFGAGLGCSAGATTCTLTGATAPPSKSIPVRCAPPASATGTQTATLTVTSDSDAGGDNTATLTCTAGRPDIMASTTALDFMTQLVNTTATPQTVSISNTGNTNLTFYFTRIGSADFSASTATSCGTNALNLCTVTPGGSMAITVGFTPTSPGSKSATLAITSNDPDPGDSPLNVTLAGTGVAPVATANPTSLAFGPVEVGKTSSAMMLTVSNTGTANLTISNAGLTAGATEYQVTQGTTGAQTTVIAPGASVAWMLTCTPLSQGLKTGNFRVVTNSGGSASNLDVGLTCTGQQGILTITPGSHDFGGVREGDAATRNFTLSNAGNVAVNNIMAVLDAKLINYGFTITAPTFPINLAANASTTVTVRFAPANANDGCVVVNTGDCSITFSGGWGTTPTTTQTRIVVTGDGLDATYDTLPAGPNALDFGEVRWDQTKQMAIRVVNTGGSTITLTNILITPGTALAGELTVVNCTRNNVVVPCPSNTANHVTSGINDTLVVNVLCNPADRVGMLDAVLTVTSDLNTQTPDRTVPLKCTSTTAQLALTPGNMVLDFGATDLDAVPVSVTRSITLMNSGAAPLNVGAATRVGANLVRFAFSATPATIVAPGASFTVDVTYTPVLEKPPNAPDIAEITFPLAGWHNGPSSMTIQIKGYGADRHIDVGPAPTFPETFKNPGDNAPIMPVTIANTGHAPLDISAVMIDNDPIWSLVNPDPVVIPATSSHDFNVRFAPVMAGKAPTGRLVIMNNDDGAPMVSVDLNGNGRDRNVAMGPRVIPLGFTGIGIPIRLSELSPETPLVVENIDTEHAFRIASIRVDTIMGADGTFEIVDRSGNEPVDVVLEPGGSHVFDITFTPNEVGDFEATATLYLDQDPSAQAQVTLRGRGLYVDARGGGGCSTTSGSPGWLVLVLVLVALAGIRRRARRLAGPAAVLCVVALAGWPATSAAQSSRNLNLNVFDPTPATVGTTFHLQPAGVGRDGDWVASALVTYANDALVLATSQNDDTAIKNRTMLMLGGAYVFGGRFEAGLRLPLLVQSGDPAGDPLMRFGVAPASGTALGDVTLHLKAQLAATAALGGNFVFGAVGALTLPTATDEQFAGNERPTGRALLLGSLVHRRLTTTLNAGGVARQSTQFANITQGSGVAWGAGASFRVLDKVWAGGEVFGDLVPGGKTMAPLPGERMGATQVLHTIEGLAGVHYRPARTTSLGIGVGRGVTSGPGTPAIRGLVTFTYAPSAEDLRPLHPPRPKLPPKDTDGDGIPDKTDECPNEPEDLDGFEDADGCPEPDNDRDGIPDTDDKCPNEPEDRDRFQDDDGCPDPDNDGDGIPDALDKCPLAAEDKDGFEDDDGCPEPDNDGDGIVDTVDKCPNEPEVINGVDDDDGCPDKGNSLVVLSPDRLELLESITFNGSRISRSSHNVLGQLGATLRAHSKIRRVRLTVHVQPSRNAAADLKLSEARAKAVRDWLVDWGVDPLRLQSSGFGGQKPLVPPTARGAQLINDRLELIILERE